MNKKAFTLLELLVVVIIIGILAAIALPKYQLAKDKADFAKYQSTAVSLRDAYNEYVLIHGEGTANFQDLSVTLPSNFKIVLDGNHMKCVQNNDMFCCMNSSSSQSTGAINCGKNDLSVVYWQTLLGRNNSPSSQLGSCGALVDNARANRLCNALGTKTNLGNTWTPNGASNKNSHQYYRLQ